VETLFFLAAKLGWALVRPATLLILLVAAALVAGWRGRAGAARAATGLALAALILAF
jgi:hypothetical protein